MNLKNIKSFSEERYLGKIIKSQMKMSEHIGFYEVVKFDSYVSCRLIYAIEKGIMKKQFKTNRCVLFDSNDFFNSEFLDCKPKDFEEKYPEYFI